MSDYNVGDKVRVSYDGFVDAVGDGTDGIKVIANDYSHYDTFTVGHDDKALTVTARVVKPFQPGTVVRFGNDPALFIRNLDGSWTSAYLGFRNHTPNAGAAHRTDADMRQSIRNGHASVVYESQEPAA